MKKIITTLLILIISFSSIVTLNACTNEKESDKKIVDMGGATVTLPNNIERIVTTSEPCCDMLLALGQGDKIIGAYFRTLNNPWFNKFCASYENIESFDAYEPEVESLIAINTDIIFVPSTERAESLREKGVCAICIRFYTPSEIERAVNLLGEIFGETAKNKGKEWLQDFSSAKDYVEKKLTSIKDNKCPIAYEILADKGRGPFRTYYGDNQAWLYYAGGELATKDFANATSNTMPTEEAILATNPDIIFIGGVYARKEYEDLLNNKKWENISAVINNNIFIEPVGALAWNSCSVAYPLLIYYCFSCMYPTLFDFDLKNYTKDFYKKYYNIDFSNNDIDNMFLSLSPDGSELWN